MERLSGVGYDFDKKFDEISKMKKKNEKEKNQLLVYLCYRHELHTRETSILAQLKCEKNFEKYSSNWKIWLSKELELIFFDRIGILAIHEISGGNTYVHLLK